VPGHHGLILAEEVRFERTDAFAPPVFKTDAISLSATLPNWSGHRESNPTGRLGRPVHGRSAMPA
jgi:hypothetical protein